MQAASIGFKPWLTPPEECNMEWFTSAVKQYANFDGRAHRTAFWMYVLFYLIFYVLAMALDGLVGTMIFSSIYSLALLLPSISVCTRRLHDTGRSGWWQLLLLIPLIGLIVIVIFTVQDSQPGDNQYGPNPKGQTAGV
jgi:uncharacterized membrane protein YhaH (DUF805 family)